MLNRRIIALLVGGLLFAIAGSASAQKEFKLTGAWYNNRGPLVDIPINGAPAGCGLFGSNMLLGPPARTNAGFPDGAHTPAGTIPGPASLAGQPNAGCVGILNEPTTPTVLNPNVGAAPTKGGIRANAGAQVIVNPGPAPKSFTIQPNGFTQARGKQVVAVAVAPTVIQLASTFTLNGPVDQRPGVPLDRLFRASAHLGQPGRLGSNFAWCPPGTMASQVGNCAAPGNGGNATFPAMNGLIRYRAGTAAFGGTMQMLLGGSADVTIILGAPTGNGMVPIAHQPVAAGMSPQAQGGAYANFGIGTFAAAPGHPSYMINFPCTNPLPARPEGCSQVVSSGPTTTPSGLGPGSNYNWGMPWTTGTVTVLNTETQFLQPRTTTLTAMGSDSRDAMGAGNITLVAGGTTYRLQAVQNFAALDLIHMTISPYAPALSPTGVGLAGALIALTAGYLLRRRF